MIRLAAIALLVAAAACSNDALRRIPCTTSAGCAHGESCVLRLCAQCMGACVESEDAGAIDASVTDAGSPDASTDAGDSADAGDAGNEVDGGGVLIPNIDPICVGMDGGVIFPPANMLPDTVPATCL